MKNIRIYDTEATIIEIIQEETNATEAEIVEAVFDLLRDNEHGRQIEDLIEEYL